MNLLLAGKKLWIVAIIIIAGCSFVLLTHRAPVNFTTQIKPIINKNCISCHGGVKQKGGFSLLFREEALVKTKSGKYGIVPGNPGKSEMIRRLTLKDPEERMPYRHDKLSNDEIDLLTRWVKEGANWGLHWAYKKVEQPDLPAQNSFFSFFSEDSKWGNNEIDLFVKQKLDDNDLSPLPEATKQILLRRVSLDLIGMPAPENIAANYLNDNSDIAYERLVDTLLSLPGYGEKWTSMWLDLSRYADTKGYERDDSRNIWSYRDWLIKAFNKDMPYDQFLIEQLAGDLMPNATDDQLIATAFHRNTMTNDEGGTDNEEFRVSAVMDRVNTTWQATMGTTFACVQCHSHPYDPFKHDDYYKFMAFFNNSRDEDTYADYPLLRMYNDSMQHKMNDVIKWVSVNVNSQKASEVKSFLKTWQPAYNSLTCDSFTNSELNDTKWLAFRNNATCRLQNVYLGGKSQLMFRYQAYTPGGLWQIRLDKPDGKVIATVPLIQTKKGWSIANTFIEATGGTHDLFFTYKNNNLKKPTDNGAMFDWFYFNDGFPGKGKEGYEQMKKQYFALLTANVPTTPVMGDNPDFMKRPTFVFDRGNWLVKSNKVDAAVPRSLNAFPANSPRNRYGLAQWLTSTENPLTARTMVNRVWEQLFGTGLAETLEDLGSQGIPPTHAELLDWLSYRFMHTDNWSVKKLIRLVVTSATYRQSSKVTPELLEIDPLNKWYTRGARVRLSAEQLRDQALYISGMLNPKMYGPGVFPFQPEGIWLSPWNGAQWTESKNGEQYRRAIYTYWKRSAAYPSMLTFDGVTREVCSVRRIRTNTPLQALTTLNDSAYVVLARSFARRMYSTAPNNVALQINNGYALATNQTLNSSSQQALLQLFKKAYTVYEKDPVKTCEILGEQGEQTNAHTAALTVVANAILNLDEVVMKN